MQSLARSVHGVVAEMRQIHTEYGILWRKTDRMATLSRGEPPNPCLDRLLLLFWAHYTERGPHLLCTGSLWVVTFYRTQRRGCSSLHQRRRIFANVKGKVVELVTLVLGRLNIDFRKLL